MRRTGPHFTGCVRKAAFVRGRNQARQVPCGGVFGKEPGDTPGRVRNPRRQRAIKRGLTACHRTEHPTEHAVLTPVHARPASPGAKRGRDLERAIVPRVLFRKVHRPGRAGHGVTLEDVTGEPIAHRCEDAPDVHQRFGIGRWVRRPIRFREVLAVLVQLPEQVRAGQVPIGRDDDLVGSRVDSG